MMTTAKKNINAESIIKNMKFSYDVSENQEDTFTVNHKRYKCRIIYSKHQLTFDYQCNPEYTRPNKVDCLYSLFVDADCYECARSVDGFLEELGYTDSLQSIRRGEKAYRACGRTAAALKRIFTNDEQDALREYFSEY